MFAIHQGNKHALSSGAGCDRYDVQIYIPEKKKPSAEFLGLDEGILRLSITEIKRFYRQDPQNKSQGRENIQMAFKKQLERHFWDTAKGIKGTWSRKTRETNLMKTFGSCNFSDKHRSAKTGKS